ncbi:16S rRNA (uracil(1498)-N(3))-methyltransferase [Hoeflea sp. YIM 152468]|uniref:16S rRNA (uracil(1498)-N(3))-methyltransferase n=1 Tax=Hoeflea sp. YIM 152468 TaxID=3031759 RepID=UPI0023DA61FE|nr:16S rRNA (uracil(1498)-N(3))-methyltransferase [Hoeflea sp. YIM 152468]MDF1606812.1 16S rRNA (uracil(1498)-N(3))-methyltransferase [Hoeflea sp. YIM 152468]
MRANYKLQRLCVEPPLAPGAVVPLEKEQAHYLLTVLRLEDGAEILVFNGRDGEYGATLRPHSRKAADLEIGTQTRAQPPKSRLEFLFAPLKIGRLDYLVQKATEMGVARITPVFTDHTQLHKVNAGRLAANILEAAEQCGNLAIPDLGDAIKLEALLSGWDPARRIIFCNETQAGNNPTEILGSLMERDLALLVGPEGGFSERERTMLSSLPFVTPIPLGPRILRADTAAVAALTAVQMTIGDW